MDSEIRSVDVLVIGGGLAGLGTAAYLSRAGLSVEVVERASSLGGRGATAKEAGFSLNRGAHALFRTGEAAAALAELGVRVKGKVAPSSGSKALAGGKLHKLPTNATSLLTTGLLGLGAKGSVARLLDSVPRTNPDSAARESVTEWLDRLGLHPEARPLMEALVRVTTYANAPDSFSAKTAIRQLTRGLQGVIYVDGGWQTLVAGLAAVATQRGATLTNGARIEALSRDPHGRYQARLGNGTMIGARAVVLAVAPLDAAPLIATAGGRVPASYASSRPLRTATLCVALSRRPESTERFILGIDAPLYLSVHSDVAQLAPPGGALVSTMKYLPAEETDPADDRRELEALLDLGVPGWRGVLVHEQYLPRMIAAERADLGAEGGDGGRPSVEVPSLPRVFVAGDWVQGGSWIADAALGSARAAATSAIAALEPSRAVA